MNWPAGTTWPKKGKGLYTWLLHVLSGMYYIYFFVCYLGVVTPPILIMHLDFVFATKSGFKIHGEKDIDNKNVDVN